MPLPISRIRIDDIDLAYARVGDDSPAPLLFLHGLGDSSIISFPEIATAPALGGRSAILLDLPGFGFSTAPEGWPATIEDYAGVVIRLLDALDVSRVAIVAHSMGASLAILVAARIPERIVALVLAEPLLVREHSELGKAIAKRTEEEFVARGYGMLLLATQRQARRGEKAAAGFLRPLEMADPGILHRSAVSLLADRSPSFLQALGELAMPRVLLVGERTDVDLSIVPEAIPSERIAAAGHSMVSENPDGVVRAIAAHLPPPERD